MQGTQIVCKNFVYKGGFSGLSRWVHRRAAENAEETQRFFSSKSLRLLSALCGSAVSDVFIQLERRNV